MVHRFIVHAPSARQVLLFIQGCHTLTVSETVMARHPGEVDWHGEAEVGHGDLYWFVVDGAGPLLDPDAMDVAITAHGPRSAFRASWPKQTRLAAHHADPVVYELHVRGFARTFAGCLERLPYLVDLGVNVIELMPVHPFDPGDNYWGYMPWVWGAVHRPYAAGDDAADELSMLVGAAHAYGLEVWLDVVFNHTGEGDATMPTLTLRGLDDANAYLHRADGSYNDDSGCGNVSNPGDPYVQQLIVSALDRFADLGIDGFRFDLASLLTRDGGGLIDRITQWGVHRGVRLIAEPWDLAEYQVGKWPSPWLEWNDRFRDDVRGFVRGEAGLVPAVMCRLQGSPDLFATAPACSVNFITAHDGLTMHDLTIVTSDHHHSWDCGDVLRMQQLKNYFTMLLLSAGTPMFVMGDEFARTQDGHDNPYNVDSELTRVDWGRLDAWSVLHDYVRELLRLRAVHRPANFRFYGVDSVPDTSMESRALAWSAGGLYGMANAGWAPETFVFQEDGPWVAALSSVAP
ncbi:MAG: alpha-amylase family glycosyl hydrolase, partial [Ilumatobacteraceae bacterium]